MSLRDIEIKSEYRSSSDRVAKDFFIPALSEAIEYKRAVGFFSSTSLIEISKGLGAFVQNGGKIQLVASPKLSQEDVDAINLGYKLRDSVIKESLLKELTAPQNSTEKKRLNLLANLIANETLEIRIAFVENERGIGIYHEKMGVLSDEQGNKVAFSGSLNETKTAMVDNYEAIDVFRSWDDPETRVSSKESAFEAIWNNYEPRIETIAFPDIRKEIIERYLIEPPDYSMDKSDEQTSSDYYVPRKRQIGLPRLPDSFTGFYDYQKRAIENWQNAGYRGLFDMATGSGKTFTGLGALLKAFDNAGGRLAVFIVCPYQHLVEQWVDDALLFGIKPIIAHSGSSQRNWKQALRDAVFDQQHGVLNKEFFCCLCTNATFSSNYVQNEIKKLSGAALLIADEVHNMGAVSYKKSLTETFNYRLGLSATIERHHDNEGTLALFNYFGEKCIEYPIDQAIKDKKLTPYKYYPVLTSLTNAELEEYQSITREIGRHIVKNKITGTQEIDKTGELLLLKRARLIAAAANKIPKLIDLIRKYSSRNHLLIYCGAASILPENEDTTPTDPTELKQINIVVRKLGHDLGMRVSKFTAEEKIAERKIVKKQFAEGTLQALVAIKCLDEGVNIPSIRTAFMLASTTNPKEYIQRRGRLLRLDPKNGKEFAEIYDFITLPRPLNDVYGMTVDERNREIGLVKNELARADEFTRIADNFSSAQAVLDTIRDAYRVDVISDDYREDFSWESK